MKRKLERTGLTGMSKNKKIILLQMLNFCKSEANLKISNYSQKMQKLSYKHRQNQMKT